MENLLVKTKEQFQKYKNIEKEYAGKIAHFTISKVTRDLYRLLAIIDNLQAEIAAQEDAKENTPQD